jgi:hypothetical protein
VAPCEYAVHAVWQPRFVISDECVEVDDEQRCHRGGGPRTGLVPCTFSLAETPAGDDSIRVVLSGLLPCTLFSRESPRRVRFCPGSWDWHEAVYDFRLSGSPPCTKMARFVHDGVSRGQESYTAFMVPGGIVHGVASGGQKSYTAARTDRAKDPIAAMGVRWAWHTLV